MSDHLNEHWTNPLCEDEICELGHKHDPKCEAFKVEARCTPAAAPARSELAKRLRDRAEALSERGSAAISRADLLAAADAIEVGIAAASAPVAASDEWAVWSAIMGKIKADIEAQQRGAMGRLYVQLVDSLEEYARAALAAVPAAAPIVQPVGNYATKAFHWFDILQKCALLLEVPDDEGIPSGVLRRVQELTAAPTPSTADAKDAARYRFVSKHGWPQQSLHLGGTRHGEPYWYYGTGNDMADRHSSPEEAIDAAIASSAGEVKP